MAETPRRRWPASAGAPPGDERLAAAAAERVVVIGVGNALRGDDAAGLEVARRIRSRSKPVRAPANAEIATLEHEGEPLGLLELWDGARAAVLVDAFRSNAAPGTIHRVDASCMAVPVAMQGSRSTHALGVGEAIEIARTLGRLPARVIVYGVEGLRFDAGGALSLEVRAVIDPLAETVLDEACSLAV